MTASAEPAANQIDVAANLAAVKASIAAATREAGRQADAVTLVAVSKTHAANRIEPVIAAGQIAFGENRVQEALAKWPDIKARHGHVHLHLIGPLQSNKARRALALFDVIESVDREKLARTLARLMAEDGRRVPCFIQVNTGDEVQKAGVAPRDLDVFVALCRGELALPVVGLMCIPPLDEEAALHFALLAELARRNDLGQLSMGMSADYETAIAMGASHVRVGTAIFGPREVYSPD